MTTGKDDPPKDAFDEEATQFMPAPNGDAANGATWIGDVAPVSATVAPVSVVQIGTLINNNYKVTEVLSAGGMGEVYKGENVYTDDPVAIKVMLDKLAQDKKASAMFMREARTLSQLSDDAIVRYYNFVRDPGIDRFCLIMEFIEGVPLSDYMATYGPIPLVAAEMLLRRIAKGLEKAHRSGVIHRDLSPDNVMLPSGIIAEARLIDFGIAKSTHVSDAVPEGEFAGKFKFVSPEQLGHFGGTIGPSTDIYGLALLISAAVLGKPLEMGGSIIEAVKAREQIPDLSGVPDDLRPLLMYMLEPDPANRPSSMAQVAALLVAPEDIPAPNHQGRPPPIKRDVTATSFTHNVPGLALPPTTVRGGVVPIRPTNPQPVPTLEPTGLNGGALKAIAGVFGLLIAGLGFFAFNQGFFDDTALVYPPAAANSQPADLTPLQPNSREGFLATFEANTCSYATRIGVGPRAGSIDAFARAPLTFSQLPTAYEEQFGARPTVSTRLVTPAQCPVLEFARNLQGRAVPPADLQLAQMQVESGEMIDGGVFDPTNGHIWLALITPSGLVYNLSDRLATPTGGQQSFQFQLQLRDGESAAPQLLLAVVTTEPLVSAAQARAGVQIDVVLPLILDEIKQRGGQGTATVGHVVLGSEPALDEQL